MGPFLIILVIIIAIAWFAIMSYNRVIKLQNNRENAFADIDVQLKQRYDLIPQLLNAVKGYMKHESAVLTRVTEARAGAMWAGSINEKIAAEWMMASALSWLKVAVEAYPDLKANESFNNLQKEISDVENKLSAVRRFFNSATKELNNAIETFPANIIANMFGFKEEKMFEATESKETLDKAPEISF